MKSTALGLLCLLIFSISAFSQQQITPVARKADHFRVTQPLRDMKKIAPGERDRSWKDNVIKNEVNTRSVDGFNIKGWKDPVLQEMMGKGEVDAPIVNFEGMGNLNGVLPPDTDGDVGPNHFFQMINLSFAIFDKSGNLLDGPYDNSTLWDGFIGSWTGTNDGDPIILYDEQADRWMASQFAVNTSVTGGTYWELIAVSVTNDPMGAYYQYAWQFPAMNDYPKFGIWPDGYYASFNMFGSYNRGAAAVFQRDSMLVGSPNAIMLLADLENGSEPWNMLPSDCDGANPPAGTPNFFLYFLDYAGTDEIRIWEFHTDWVTISNSSFSDAGTLNPSAFDSDICTATRERCIQQPGTTAQLEAMSDRLMYRLQYRNFGTHETMVLNHTVDVGSGHAGIRWYELRDNGGGWGIQQQGTYSPDGDHRWMGSIAMDGNGNIGLGYSVSSSSTYPSIRYTGRLSTDPPGIMTEPETTIIAGGGSQTYTSAPRWGDYSHMAIDPSDDSTFWYTTEYMQTNASADWKTRVASFRITPSPPIANFSASNTSPFVGSAVSFTDLSASSPTSWAWTITPGTFTYTGGTNASSQNPEVSFSAGGSYTVTLVATNAYGSDGETKVDYITAYENLPITLPWIEDFEPVSPTVTFTANQNPISGIPEWAYEKTANGRLRFQAGSGFYHGGTHAATMDANPAGTNSVNYLTTTLNLTNYTTAELELSFWFMHHGEESNTNDRVWIRGSDSDTWVQIYDLYANRGTAGEWNQVSSLDIDALLAAAVPSQTVSSTFQIRLGQEDNYPATSTTVSDGFTFDDIRVEEVGGAAPVVDFTSDVTSGESGVNINFTDLSSNSPTQWRWNFPGGIPSYSEAQNPAVRYDNEGYYDVTLTASNGFGSDYLSKSDYLGLTAESIPYNDDFESASPAWNLTGEFQRGAPAGLGGVLDGNPDPTSAYQGSNVIGTDLTGLGSNNGDYEPSLGSLAYTAVSPVINCSNYTDVRLGFMRYLNVETATYDEAFIHVNNGSGWVEIWANGATITDAAWTWVEYDISAVADGEASVQVRFGLGPTDGLDQFSGWNIDSLVVKGQALGSEHHVSWTGGTSNDWNNPANWSHGSIPDANTNVFIPQFIPGGNEVNTFSSSTSEMNDLNVERNAILTIPSGHTMTVNGDIKIDED